MESQALSTGFDYGFLPAADGKALEKRAQNIERIQERARKATAEAVLKLGQELLAAQSILSNHGNGTFQRWAKDRCGLSPTSAFRTIQAVEAFKDTPTVGASFEPSAMYLLAADNCPEEAFDKAIELAEAGEVITKKRAKEIIESYATTASDESDHEPENWSLHVAMKELDDILEQIESQWPEECREILGRKLIAIGECMVQLAENTEEVAA